MAEGVRFPEPEKFSTMLNQKQVALYTLTNANGLRVDITNFGGRIVSLLVPDKHGLFEDVVTGYHSIDEYLNNEEMFFGALIGRYGNRIANASFSLEGQHVELVANNGPNNLHGGPKGFHNVVWDAELINDQTLRLTYLSPDMEEGFPGNLSVTVIYRLTGNNELSVGYRASTDKATHVNLTNHAYFNLAGEGNKPIDDHLMKIHADLYVPVDETMIPTGVFDPVENTPFDFRKPRHIGERIDADHSQIRIGGGYDHSFVIRGYEDPSAMKMAAEVVHPASGIKMDVLTMEPGVQFYSGNFMAGKHKGKRGELYGYRTAFCLETQHFPDSPNRPDFPSTLLKPGQTYQTTTIYRFSVLNNH